MFLKFCPSKKLLTSFADRVRERIESTSQPEKFTFPRLLDRLSLHARLLQVMSFFLFLVQNVTPFHDQCFYMSMYTV